MKSLRDVLPAGSKTVILRSKRPAEEQISVDVHGIDFNQLGPLFQHFPELYAALNGGKIDAATLSSTLPARAVNALIAAGCNALGDAELEAGIANLALFEKFALLAPIVEFTIGSDGAGPFVDLVRAFGLGAKSEVVDQPAVEAPTVS